MAKEAAAAFVKRYGSDEAFRTKVNELNSPQAIRAFLDQEGFGQFTRQELEDARTAASASDELSDAELEAVAGGDWGVVFDYKCTSRFSSSSDYCPTQTCTSVW